MAAVSFPELADDSHRTATWRLTRDHGLVLLYTACLDGGDEGYCAEPQWWLARESDDFSLRRVDVKPPVGPGCIEVERGKGDASKLNSGAKARRRGARRTGGS